MTVLLFYLDEEEAKKAYHEWYLNMTKSMTNERPYTKGRLIMVRKVFGTTLSTVNIWATNKEVPDPCHTDSVYITSMESRSVSTVKLVHPTDKRKSMKEHAGWRCRHDSVNQILGACRF